MSSKILILRDHVTPQIYKNMLKSNQEWYVPEYRKYKTKKVRNYQDCDLGYAHFVGWVEESTPIGEPYRYAKISRYEHTLKLTRMMLLPEIEKEIDSENRFMTKMMINESKNKS